MKIGWFLSVRQNSSRFPGKSTSIFYDEKTIPQFLYERISSFISTQHQKSGQTHFLCFLIPDDNLQSQLEQHSLDILSSQVTLVI